MSDRLDEILATVKTVATQTLSLDRRMSVVEERQRRFDSVAPRALRAVSDSVHEHDTEMAAVAVHMGEQARLIGELKAASDRHAAELSAQSRAQSKRLTGAVVIIAPIVAKLLDLLIAWRST